MKTYLLLIFFTLLGCSKDEYFEVKYSPYLGGYKLISLESDTPLDLNRDGIATTDFLIEINEYFEFYSNLNLPTLEIIQSSSNKSNNIFSDYIPKQNVNPFNTVEISYINSGPAKTLKFNEDFTIVKEIDLYYSIEDYIHQKWAILVEVFLTDNSNITAKFKQQYYTDETGWKTCILIAHFEKIK
jgi:hypothetical protein